MFPSQVKKSTRNLQTDHNFDIPRLRDAVGQGYSLFDIRYFSGKGQECLIKFRSVL